MPDGGTLRHVDPLAEGGRMRRAYVALLATPLAAWLSRNVVWKVDPWLLRVTGGRLGFGLMLPTALLETRGARSGRRRRNAVIYFHDAERVTLVASNLGAPRHPSWFHNAVAGDVVRLNGLPYRATVVDNDAERDRLWALADRVFPPYADYRRRAAAAGRTIPLLQLTAAPDPGAPAV